MICNSPYQIKYSKRKSVCASYDIDGTLKIQAPSHYSIAEIERFLDKHKNALSRLKQKMQQKIVLKADLLNQGFKKYQAIALLNERFNLMYQHANLFNIYTSYPPIFKLMISRWGSCNKNGQIHLNILLGFLPINLIDAVIAHELCHIKEMNHSKKFYTLLNNVYPDYKYCNLSIKKYIIHK